MAGKDKEISGNELSVMFPGEVVDINGCKITMKPLPLKYLPSVMKQFSGVIEMLLKEGYEDTEDTKDTKDKKSVDAKVAMEAISEAIILLPYCMFTDQKGELTPLSIGEVPAYAVVKLMKVFLKQNIPDDMLGEWEALIGKETKDKVPND